jgi:suppressor of ftsI
MKNEQEQQMNMKSQVTKSQMIAVTALTLVILGAGIFVAAFYGNFLMSPGDMQQLKSSFSQSTTGLAEANASETVELKNGDTFNLTASIVKKKIGNSEVKMLAYNGSVPGPVIKVQQGSEIIVNLTNKTDVATTIHPHGVRVENAFDGVPDVTQKVVEIGDTFAYKLKFPDPGLYWYHPHFRQDYSQDAGLYGAFLVEPSDPNYWSRVNREEVLMVDDVLMENGQLAAYDKNKVDHALMGRFGNTMLVNGDTEYKLDAKQGEVVRFYINNAANTRTFNLSIPNARIKLVGSDSEKYEKETFVDNVIIAPSERAVVEVLFEKPGKFALQHKTPDKTYTMGTISVTSESVAQSYAKEFAALRINKDIAVSIDPLRGLFGKTPDKKLSLTVETEGMMENMNSGGHMMPDGSMMGGQMSDGDKIEWEDNMAMMNVNSTPDNTKWKMVDRNTNKANMDIDWKFKVGDKVKVSIFNDPKSMHPMQHPIHFHGQRFLVLSTNGVANTNLVWKDTTLVQTGDTVEILIDMSNPGKWLAHCHISEHPEAGMMIPFTVES